MIIKFRGKRADNNEWVYGYYVYDSLYNIPTINDGKGNYYRVHPETVGQFIGLPDKNGKDIYDGDIIGREGFINRIVFHDGVQFRTYLENNPERHFPLIKQSIDEYDEVIGNIHDKKLTNMDTEKTIGIRKVDNLLEGSHPNNINVGYEKEGLYQGQTPVVGQSFYVLGYDGRMLATSAVEEILSPTRFRTHNSVYEWSVWKKNM